MLEYIIQIEFVNSPGLGYEIIKLTEKNSMDKIAMEVLPEKGMVIQFQCTSGAHVESLLNDLKRLKNIKSVSFRNQMPYREKEHELRTILNSVSEGVLAVDKDGQITHINNVARKLLVCESQEVIGLKVESLLGANSPLVDTLTSGRCYRLNEQKIARNGKTAQILISSLPIRNDHMQIIGAVSTIQDFHQVEKVILQAGKRRKLTTFDGIVYQNNKTAKLVKVARTVAKSTSTILLRGESGTGKELFATAIHGESLRRNGPFIAVNCTALTDTLLESELFGYEEGAFTGAAKNGKKGLFEQADGGTLFLDEVGDITPRLQVQLLRVLQEGTIRRVGGNREIEVDVRIIAATHRNLEEMIRVGEFREDLYYRLNVIPITLLPLRDRKEDIPLLVPHLIRKICAKLDKPEIHLSKESMDLFAAQDWPGNVRQLENTLERLINLSDSSEIRPEDIFAWTDVANQKNNKSIIRKQQQQILQVEIPLEGEWPQLKNVVANVEKEVIRRVLEKYPSSRLAGQVLGVSNTTILNKMKAYKL